MYVCIYIYIHNGALYIHIYIYIYIAHLIEHDKGDGRGVRLHDGVLDVGPRISTILTNKYSQFGSNNIHNSDRKNFTILSSKYPQF